MTTTPEEERFQIAMFNNPKLVTTEELLDWKQALKDERNAPSLVTLSWPRRGERLGARYRVILEELLSRGWTPPVQKTLRETLMVEIAHVLIFSGLCAPMTEGDSANLTERLTETVLKIVGAPTAKTVTNG